MLITNYNSLKKKILVPKKYEIIMVPSNYSFFQYCDGNIRLFSIATCKVIDLYLLCLFFGISSLLLFLIALPKFIAPPTIAIAIIVALSRSFSLLEAIAKRLPLLFANAFKSVKDNKCDNFCYRKDGRAITIKGAID